MAHDPNTAAPTSSNPADYARATRVQDDEALMLEAQFALKATEYRRLAAQAEVLRLETEAVRARMFFRLDERYPDIGAGQGGGTGIRHHDGALYYVGWDALASS
jgi:hypothetical protein